MKTLLTISEEGKAAIQVNGPLKINSRKKVTQAVRDGCYKIRIEFSTTKIRLKKTSATTLSTSLP